MIFDSRKLLSERVSTRKTFLGVSGLLFAEAAYRRSSAAETPQFQDARITIDRSIYNGALMPRAIGLSYEKSKLTTNFFRAENYNLVGLFKRLGPGVLRVGGNTVDHNTWAPNGVGATKGQIAPADVTGLAEFLKKTGWQVIYGINLAMTRPELISSEVTYASNAFGDNLSSFEIGNECDGYSRNGIRPATYTVDEFISEWLSAATVLRQAVPNAPLSGPASGYRIGDWTVPFAQREGALLKYLTQHYYQGSGKSATYTVAELLAPHDFFPRILEQLRDAAASNNIAGGYRLSETGSLYSGGAHNISDAYASALWTIDLIMTSSQYGCIGVNLHGGGDGSYNPYYTPIEDLNSEVTNVRPPFYGLLFASHIGPGKMCSVKASSPLNLSAYAVDAKDAMYVAIVNKDASTTARTEIDLGAPGNAASIMTLKGPNLGSLVGTELQGEVVAPNGAWHPRRVENKRLRSESVLSLKVTPASAVLVKVT